MGSGHKLRKSGIALSSLLVPLFRSRRPICLRFFEALAGFSPSQNKTFQKFVTPVTHTESSRTKSLTAMTANSISIIYSCFEMMSGAKSIMPKSRPQALVFASRQVYMQRLLWRTRGLRHFGLQGTRGKNERVHWITRRVQPLEYYTGCR